MKKLYRIVLAAFLTVSIGSVIAGLESPFTGKYITDLVATNPADIDQKSEGDDHMRGIKLVLQNSFPAVSGAVGSSHTELNLLDGVTVGSSVASKVPVLDAQRDLDLGTGDLAAVIVTASTVTGASVNSTNSTISGTATIGTADITSLEIGSAAVTATAAELNKLAGSSVSGAELDIMDGNTVDSSTVIVDTDQIVINDNGVMEQTAVTDLATYINASAGSGNVTASGTLTSNKLIKGGGTTVVTASGIGIDASNNMTSVGTIGSGAITSTGAITSGGSISAPNGSTISIDAAVITEAELERLDSTTGDGTATNDRVMVPKTSAFNFNNFDMDNVDIDSGNIASAVVLANGIAATTQTSTDDTTKLATTAFVHDVVEAAIYSGTVDASAETVAGNTGWTVVENAVGQYDITHNLGTTNYHITLGVQTNTSAHVVSASWSSKLANTIRVQVARSNASSMDLVQLDFDFMVITY